MNTSHQLPVARDLMNRHVECVTMAMSLNDLVSFFLKHDVTCAPVIDKGVNERVLLGFVSEGDALTHLSNEMFGGFSRESLTVATMMKRHPVAVTADTDVFSIASIFISHGYRHVPVVDSDHRLLGLISRHEILAALSKYDDKAIREYNREHFPPDLHKIINHRFIVSNL